MLIRQERGINKPKKNPCGRVFSCWTDYGQKDGHTHSLCSPSTSSWRIFAMNLEWITEELYKPLFLCTTVRRTPNHPPCHTAFTQPLIFQDKERSKPKEYSWTWHLWSACFLIKLNKLIFIRFLIGFSSPPVTKFRAWGSEIRESFFLPPATPNTKVEEIPLLSPPKIPLHLQPKPYQNLADLRRISLI